MGYEFYVNEDVLVPRQDTETLMEAALEASEGKQGHVSWICVQVPDVLSQV